MQRTADERRHHDERKKTWARTQSWAFWYSDKPLDPAAVGKVARTPHPCSCLGCGNPRRHYKGEQRLTMQERRVAVQKDEDIDVRPT